MNLFLAETDLAGIRTLQTMCTLALETCSQWFPNETK